MGIIYGLVTPRGKHLRIGFARSRETLVTRLQHWHLNICTPELAFAQHGASQAEAKALFGSLQVSMSDPKVTAFLATAHLCDDASWANSQVMAKPRPIPFHEHAQLNPRHSTIAAVLSGRPIV